MIKKWWIYQKERFPVVANGVLIAAFSLSAVAHSMLLRSGGEIANFATGGAVAFVSGFLFFLQLRIFDEFKDYEDDRQYRPYRPVPRGLVSLRELAIAGVIAAGIQLAFALGLSPRLVLLLLLVWGYMGLMGREFFVPEWLKKHPIAYLISHMAIMPAIAFYCMACDWGAIATTPPAGFTWFLLVSFFNGIIIEIGRKIRSPDDEETGVETYSVLWGRRKAVFLWLTVCGVTAICALRGAAEIEFMLPVLILLVGLLVTAALVSRGFLAHPYPKAGKRIEILAGIWTLLMYLSLGAIPLGVRYFFP
ncbi:UbiA family prenyltransferase [Phormidium sp. CCY1219]|uniref:UbiA family prenyltransferase n=1 Tax=Phormidium sp. CCY1219 TaxID=2886104 RepID=UPI002D1F0BB7|nr:UbiA family prenyltransferase [Phormidium sp. CCY1219]MEB3829776.1 UbiA family prenyltransferase [Phormidium sp. CCY1219]